jgi:pimeloyl-ACP methyl ester carboxylesterase
MVKTRPIGSPSEKRAAVNRNSLPELEGVQHQFVDLGGGVTIHVADAGPADGAPVMLVHGFPQHWWEWHELIGPLAGDGYRVLCPDLRGAGWSSAPRDRYFKTDMADDLASVLDRLAVGPARLVAHDWGGPVAILMMLRHPEKVTGFFGLNTIGPWSKLDLASVRDLWRLWHQVPMVIPWVGPRVIGDPKGRYLRMICRWGGAGFLPPDFDLYIRGLGEPVTRSPGHAGTAPPKPAKSRVGYVASTEKRGSTSRSGGCTGWMTPCLRP